VGVFGRSLGGVRVDVEGDYARCSRPGCHEGEDTRSRSHVGHAFASQVYIREEVCEEFAREKVSGVEHCRSHRETESSYARHRCPAAREDKMIGQEVNCRTQKLLRAARRKRGTVQGAGVLVRCSHVVSSQTGDLGISFRDIVGDRGCFVCRTTASNEVMDITKWSI
jgi:hypothetical protein